MQDKSNVPLPHYATPETEPKRTRGLGWIAILVVVVIFFGAWKFSGFANFPSVHESEWQAVFLDNNQVYFGHLKSRNREYAVLNNIFYLRVTDSLQQGAPPGSGLNLVKLGEELHGPQDVMYISKDKITFWENLKSDSQVVQAINGFLNQPK